LHTDIKKSSEKNRYLGRIVAAISRKPHGGAGGKKTFPSV